MSRHENRTHQAPPASGERRAIRAYAAQYRVAATLTYEALREGRLEWIHLADPEAGRLDDLVIATRGRVDAYQVKWESYENRISFHDLVMPSRMSGSAYPSPINILGDGWRRLREAYPDRKIGVHFLANLSPSTSDDTRGAPAEGPNHLQAFLRHAFAMRDQWFDPQVSHVTTEWARPIQDLLDASSIESANRAAFLRDCYLDLGFKLPEDSSVPPAGTAADDIDAIADLFFKLVSSPTARLHLTLADLVRHLGWEQRFEFRFAHEFPVDESLYRPVTETIRALEDAFSKFNQGYLALVGAPGSGKSTTLTQMLRYRQGVRTIRYYAFVKGDIRQGRGEAENFLADLCLAIEQSSISSSPRTRAFGKQVDGQTRLTELLAALADDWIERGVRTIVLIDGLDHIEREQTPQRSLIEVLPHPDTVPEGVVIVLGTQQVGLESGLAALRPIRAHLQSAERQIEMARLDRPSVYSLINAAIQTDHLEPGEIEQIYSLSDGHPLALNYLVRKIGTCRSRADIKAVLEGTTAYDGDIEALYRTYWEVVRTDSEVRDVLGLLSRIRGSFDLDLLEHLSTEAVIDRLVATARYFFQEETPSKWAFFHNSFRQFLLSRTAEDGFGRFSVSRDKAFHKRLADHALSAPDTSPWSWEATFHLYAAGETERQLAFFSQSRVRSQYFALRPLPEIFDDINKCVNAAANQVDPLAIIRALLIEHELTERSEALSEIDLQKLLLHLSDINDVSDVVFDGRVLRIAARTVLEFSATLYRQGHLHLARRLFDSAEPLEVLSGIAPVEGRGTEDLRAWIKCAWLFRPLDDIFAAVRRISFADEPIFATQFDDDDQSSSSNTDPRGGMLLSFLRDILVHGRTDLLPAIEREFAALGFDSTPLQHDLNWLKLRTSRLYPNLWATTGEVLQVLSAANPTPESETAVELADAALCLNHDTDTAIALMRFAADPLIVARIEYGDGPEIGTLGLLLLQARTLSALGKPIDPVSGVPDPVDPDRRGAVLFQRLVVTIGNVWGDAVAGRPLAPSEVVRQLRPALFFFQRAWSETQQWSDWYAIERKAPAFFKLTLRAAEAHGAEALQGVLEVLTKDWERTGSRRHPGWRQDWKRSITTTALELDGNVAAAAARLEQLETRIDIEDELQSRLSEYEAHIWARLKLGQRDKAWALLERMVASSFGIYHRKDDQLARWSSWAERFAQVCPTPNEAKAALTLLLKTVPLQHQSSRGVSVETATTRLLNAASRTDLAWAQKVGRFLLETGGAERTAVLAGLLKGCLDRGTASDGQLALVAIKRLLLPFEGDPSPLLQDAVAEALKSHPELGVRSFRTALRTKAFASNYRSWMAKIDPDLKDNHETDVDDTDLTFGASSPTEKSALTLKDGRHLNNAELKTLASNKEEFLDTLRRATTFGRE